tara:strand:+ start:810 stop:1439 length:630 start_codon:yes stop_codon:yes gene_type:complete
MWARLDASKEVLEIIATPKPMTLNGVQHPKNIFNLWSSAELETLNIYPVNDPGHPNPRFYTFSAATYTFNSGTKSVDVSYTSTAKSLTDSTYTSQDKTDGVIPEGKDVGDVKLLGLKNAQIKEQKRIAGGNLSSTDWYVLRNVERSKAIPSNVSTYRTAVITTLDTMETKINAVSDIDAFKKLFDPEFHANGVLKAGAVMYTWPEVIDG